MDDNRTNFENQSNPNDNTYPPSSGLPVESNSITTSPPRKSSSIFISIAIAISIIVVIGIILLFVTKNNNPNVAISAPSPSRVEDFCKSRGLKYFLLEKGDSFYMDSDVEFDYMEEKLSVVINSEAICLEVDSDGSLVADNESGINSFGIYFMNEDYRKSIPIRNMISVDIKVLEDSEDYFKAIARVENNYSYVVAYRNTILVMSVKDTNVGEAIITELYYSQ